MKIKVGNKNLTIRKWKGKDKKVFLNLMKAEKPDETAILDALVYSCIEEDVILSVQEMKYVLTKIRSYSLGDDFEISLTCDKCNTESIYSFKISEVIKGQFIDRDEIISGDTRVKLGKIKNKNIYLKKIVEDDMYDLLLRVESFNGDDAFTLDDLIEKFDDLDIDILEDIIDQWETIRFKINDVNDVECLNCNEHQLYSFDAIPNFFPESWLK